MPKWVQEQISWFSVQYLLSNSGASLSDMHIEMCFRNPDPGTADHKNENLGNKAYISVMLKPPHDSNVQTRLVIRTPQHEGPWITFCL